MCSYVFIVMLSYKIHMHLRNAWKEQDITVEEGLEQLSALTAINIKVKNQILSKIPKPNLRCKKLLDLLEVRFPTYLPYVEFDKVTKINPPIRKKV